MQTAARLNWVDLVVIILTLRACYSGFGRGFLAELCYCFGVVTLTALVCNVHGTVARQLSAWWPLRQPVLDVTTFLLLLAIGALGLRLIIRRLAAQVTGERLHWSIQNLGFVLGALRGLWWSGLILWLLIGIGPYFSQSIEQHSLLGPKVLELSRQAIERTVSWYPGYTELGVLVPTLNPPNQK